MSKCGLSLNLTANVLENVEKTWHLSLNVLKFGINVLEKFKKCPGMSLNVLEFDFENPVATMLWWAET